MSDWLRNEEKGRPGPNTPKLFKEHLDLLSLNQKTRQDKAHRKRQVRAAPSSTGVEAAHSGCGSGSGSLQPRLPACSSAVLQIAFPATPQAVTMETAVRAKQSCPIFTLWLTTPGPTWRRAILRPQASVGRSGDRRNGDRGEAPWQE